MPKRYSVTPRRPPGRPGFIANFYNSAGARVTRSLFVIGPDGKRRTVKDEDAARTLCVGFVTLRNAGVRTVAEALELDTHVSPDCYPLFFGESACRESDETLAIAPAVAAAIALAHRAPVEASIAMPPALKAERKEVRQVMKILRAKVGELTEALKKEREARAANERSMLAHAVKASAHAPTFTVARAEFEQHLKGTVQKPSSYLRILDRFVEFLATKDVKAVNVADVLPGHIIGFLDEKADRSDVTKKAIRRRNLRTYLGRFFNWCAEKFQIVSPMSGVKAVPLKAVRRERGEIDWHTLPEIEAALQALPVRIRSQGSGVRSQDADYWHALIATLAFSGLQLAELCWLRTRDLMIAKNRKRATIWVTTVDEPSGKGKRHLLKSDNRRRHVDVHPKHLLPHLLKHLASGRSGDYFLFPMPARRKRRGFVEDGARWKEITLSTFLRGHPGGKDRKPMAGLLPAGMNAKSLRRTFGSLLIRSGKSTEEVAAAMGNTPEVVREHYARILGGEVDVDF